MDKKAVRTSGHRQVLETTVKGLMLGYSTALYEATSYPLSHLRESMEHGRSMALGAAGLT